MKYAFLSFLILLFGVTACVVIVFVIQLPATRVVLSRFAPTPYLPPEGEVAVSFDEPYRIETGAYTLESGMATFFLEHPRTATPSYRGSTHVGGAAITLATDSTGDIIGSGAISLNLSSLVIDAHGDEPGTDAYALIATGPHFFNITKHPDATFTISSIRKVPSSTNSFTVTSRLTFLGETHDLIFPATLFMREGKLKLEAEFPLDRTQWGMTYNSASFVGESAPNAISDTMRTTLTLTFTKQ